MCVCVCVCVICIHMHIIIVIKLDFLVDRLEKQPKKNNYQKKKKHDLRAL